MWFPTQPPGHMHIRTLFSDLCWTLEILIPKESLTLSCSLILYHKRKTENKSLKQLSSDTTNLFKYPNTDKSVNCSHVLETFVQNLTMLMHAGAMTKCARICVI